MVTVHFDRLKNTGQLYTPMIRPTRPKNYLLVIVSIWVLEAAILVALMFSVYAISPDELSQILSLVSIAPWMIVCQYIDSLVFPQYKRQIEEYERSKSIQRDEVRQRDYWERIKVDQTSAREKRIATNIQRYKESEALRRSKAKWWQFWV